MRSLESAWVLCVVCSLAVACSPDSPGRSENGSGARILTGRNLTSVDSLGFPAGLVARGPYLLVLDILPAHALHVIDREDGRYLAGYGPKGEGPGEFRSPWVVALDSEGSIWVSDPGLGRITRVGLREDEDERLELTTEESVAIEGPAYAVTPFGSGNFAALGLFDGGEVGVFDSSGEFLGSTAPLSGPDEPVGVRATSTLSDMAVHPNGEYVAIARRFAGQVTIVDIERDTTIQASVPVPFQAQLNVSPEGRAARSSDTRYAYADVVGTAKVILALFSGRTEAENTKQVLGGDAWLGDEVHVFDWRGHLLDVFRLDNVASGLAVEGDSLYTTVLSPLPGVRGYAMDQRLRDIINSQ